MWRDTNDSPRFDGGSLVPVATYLLTISVLSGLLLVSPTDSPPPLLGMAWGVFLGALAIGALAVEDLSPRALLSSPKSVFPAVTGIVGFWAVYNLVAYGLALGGVAGFELAGSRVAVHPIRYLAALGSSLLFTAIPEELMFRGYLQSKLVSLAGGGTRRGIAIGVLTGAVLFALFHLPRWLLATGHGVGPALATRLSGLALAGLAYGLAFLLTRNLWLVALFHATMNHPPFLVTVQYPPEFHLFVGVVEYAGIVAIAFGIARIARSNGSVESASQRHSPSGDD